MSMDVTAWIMGDPAARWIRQPTQEERDRAGRYDVMPQVKAKTGQGRNITPLGKQVRAMQPGDVIEVHDYGVANSHRQYMAREHEWTMSIRRVRLPDGSSRVELRRAK